jgi:hypothetical protein
MTEHASSPHAEVDAFGVADFLHDVCWPLLVETDSIIDLHDRPFRWDMPDMLYEFRFAHNPLVQNSIQFQVATGESWPIVTCSASAWVDLAEDGGNGEVRRSWVHTSGEFEALLRWYFHSGPDDDQREQTWLKHFGIGGARQRDSVHAVLQALLVWLRGMQWEGDELSRDHVSDDELRQLLSRIYPERQFPASVFEPAQERDSIFAQA